MNHKIISEKELYSIKDEWDYLFRKGRLQPFQSFQWQSMILKEYTGSLYYKITTKIFYIVIYEEAEPVVIAPLLMDKDRIVSFIGEISVCDYMDFIYGGCFNKKHMEEIIRVVCEKYNAKKFNFKRLKSDSKSIELLKAIDAKSINVSTSPSIGIEINSSYDDYYSKLSKKARHNLSTAFNRLVREQKNFECQFIINRKIPSELIYETEKIYKKRKKTKYALSENTSFINNIKTGIVKLFSIKYNVISNAMGEYDEQFMAVLRIDGDIAAYCYGPISKEGSAIIVRLSIDADFGKYSPGKIMIAKVVEYLFNNPQLNLNYFDLAMGGESYKLALNGIDRPVLNFCITI